MSMMIFSPIFPFLSVLGGVLTGVIFGVLLSITYVSWFYHEIPFHLIAKGIVGIILIFSTVLISFLAFRFLAGTPDFNVGRSLSHIVLQLVNARLSYFLLGVLAGFLAAVLTFLAGIANGSSGGAQKNIDHTALNGLSWR